MGLVSSSFSELAAFSFTSNIAIVGPVFHRGCTMNFKLTEEQLAFKSLARKFATEEFVPHAALWDQASIFPIETLKKAATLGFSSLYVDPSYGGMGLTRLDAAIILEELAQGCVSTTAYLSIHNMVSWLIDAFGSEDQKKAWLPELTSMNWLASYCLTEPNSGSDAAALVTTARREGDEYVLNGSKCFISGASVSDVYAVMARTGGEGPKGISCILVKKDTPGLSFGKKEEKMGWRNQPTCMVFFNHCKVPVAHRIGEEGQGFNIALSALNGGRVNIGACSLGGAGACLRLAREYLLSRQQFQKPLAEFQALQFKMADMLTRFSAARLMVYRAARAIDEKDAEIPLHAAMAKCFASDVCFEICNEALQLHGGYGYLKDYPIERFVRDLRVHQILEGTNEIMRVITARRIFSESFKEDLC